MKIKQPTPLKIVLADDDKDDRFFFGKALNAIAIPHHLKTVINGAELMDYLSKDPEHFPDVLFLDLNMPRKNGHECLDEIKNDKKLKGIPVVIYSTSLRNEVADMLYQSGAHYYLQKCDFSELPKRIEAILTLLAGNPGQPSRNKFIV